MQVILNLLPSTSKANICTIQITPMLLSLRHNVSKLVMSSIIFITSATGIVALQLPQVSKQSNVQANSPEDQSRQVEPQKTRLQLLQQMPSFGLDNLLANWTFLNFLQYFGDEAARTKTGYTLSPKYFEVILDRDPRFLDAYFFLSASSSLYAGMPEQAIELMEEQLQRLSPKDPHGAYYIWRYKALDELLFLGDAEAAQRSFEKAAEWASTYSDEEAKRVEKITRQRAQRLAENPTDKTVQINAWATVLSYAKDEQTQQNVIRRIEELGGKVSINSQGQLQLSLPEEE